MNKTILITGAGGVTGRAVARSLKHSPKYKNYRLIGSDVFYNEYEILEGIFDQLYKVPKVIDSDYESKFLQIIEKENPCAVLIMVELEGTFWSGKNLFPTLLPSKDLAKNAINKKLIHQILQNTDLVPKFHILDQKDFDQFPLIFNENFEGNEVWVRAIHEGSSSGMGAYKISSEKEFKAWSILNPGVKEFMIAENLPGRNFAHNVLFCNGELKASAIYERLEYFMGHLVPSGVSGNISVGKVLRDPKIETCTSQIFKALINSTNETSLNGLFTVDYKFSQNGSPKLTEINLRHTAATEAFALGGYNIAEYQVDCIINKTREKIEAIFSDDNLFFRDIDGLPMYSDDINRDRNLNLIDLT